MQAGGGKLPRSLAVTSAMPGDGKSLTAINLALSISSNEVVVVFPVILIVV